jgi:hypothetical protein
VCLPRLQDRPAKFPRVMVIALVLFSAFYLLLGVAGFALLGMDGATLPSPISDAFDATPLHIGAIVLYALQARAAPREPTMREQPVPHWALSLWPIAFLSCSLCPLSRSCCGCLIRRSRRTTCGSEACSRAPHGIERSSGSSLCLHALRQSC